MANQVIRIFSIAQIVTGVVAILVGDNTGATREPGEPMHADSPGRGSLLVAMDRASFRPVEPGNENGHVAAAPVDVYRGSAVTALERVPSQRNAVRNNLVFHAHAGETYFIAVDNPGYYSGPFELWLSEPLWPANDSFANRIQLDGASPVWTGQNVGHQPNLPNPIMPAVPPAPPSGGPGQPKPPPRRGW
jgi:hypothetical protein